jgi:hypothetical protein
VNKSHFAKDIYQESVHSYNYQQVKYLNILMIYFSLSS